MAADTLDVFFHPDVLSMRSPDGLFERKPSPLLDVQIPFAEGPDRIANVHSVMSRGPSAGRFRWHEGRHATDAEILTFHTEPYLEELKAGDVEGKWFTDTTHLPAGGLKGVRAGAGTALAALENVMAEGPGGKGRMSYAIVRPPSHHAAADVADGYCFLNGVAMAALQAQARGLPRVAVVDWDVHHGNGTQEGFYDRNDVLTISMHMNHGAWSPESHPQTGEVDEIGAGAGTGYNINLPVPFGAGNGAYEAMMTEIVVPALRTYGPDLIIVSNGQDASQFDPNGRNLLNLKGFHRIADIVARAAEELCDGRLLIVQEGGYNVAYTGFCAYATALGFLGQPLDLADPLGFYPEDPALARATVDALIARHPLLDGQGAWKNPAG
jgi:acetoin utilization deacetylase AcuC-like enzyme